MPSISLTLPTAGTNIAAGLHATNYSALQTLLNGGLDNTNIAPGAAIELSKLAGGTNGHVMTMAGGVWTSAAPSTTQPYANVSRVAAQSIPNQVQTTLSWDTEGEDTTGMRDPAAPTRITITTAGLYIVTGYIVFAANTNGQRQANVRLSGTDSFGSSAMALTNGNSHILPVCCVVRLAAADYIELSGYQSSGGALNATSLMTVARLGA